MGIPSYEIEETLNKKFLDTLDLDKYLSQSNDVQTIIELIENDYDDSDDLPVELEGCIFNFLDNEDVAYYLAERYGLRVHEEISYKLFCINKKCELLIN